VATRLIGVKSVRESKGSARATCRAITSEDEKKPSVVPSGAARATASAATLPAAPGRLVISMGRPPRRSRSPSASTRAAWSVLLPLGKPTSRRSGRASASGARCCAAAGTGAAAMPATRAIQAKRA
jgi:hypothetical protein